MSEFLYDKAIMALKAQRYDEAQSSYEQALQVGYSVEAWTGLGVCKLFQIAEGQTMEEVLYCFEKARGVEGADNKEIDLKLLLYSQVVILQCGAYAISSIKNAIEAKKNLQTAALIGLASAVVGSYSDTSSTKMLAGAAAATAAGVAVGKFGEIKSSEEIVKFSTDLLQNIYNNVYEFLIEKDKTAEAIELKETTDRLCNEIIKETPAGKESIKKEAEDSWKLELENHKDNDIAVLSKSFHELGFNKVIIDKITEFGYEFIQKSRVNDNFTCSIDTNLSTHYIGQKGILKSGTGFMGKEKYYNYNEIEDLQKSWLGNLKDKKSGYKIDILQSSDWQTPFINFIKSKQTL